MMENFLCLGSNELQIRRWLENSSLGCPYDANSLISRSERGLTTPRHVVGKTELTQRIPPHAVGQHFWSAVQSLSPSQVLSHSSAESEPGVGHWPPFSPGEHKGEGR